MLLPPVLKQAAYADTIHPVDLRVLLAASEYLDFHHFRPLKQLFVGRLLGIAPSTAGAALRRLSAAGFLDRQATGAPRQPARYRLHYSRAPEPAGAVANVATPGA